ncbi:MAG: PAS domain S-box protein [bacterium]|nr:PAS domain S-box protein [bacterium]
MGFKHPQAFDRLQRLGQIGLWSLDLSDRQVSFSAQACQLLGLPLDHEEPLERFLKRLFKDDQVGLQQALDGAVKEQRGYAYNLRLIRPDGLLRILCCRGELEKDAQGQVTGLLSTIQDVSQLGYHGLVEQDNQDLMVLLDAIQAGFFLFQNDRLFYANPKVSEITGYSREELVGMHFAHVIHPEEQARIKAQGEARQRGEPAPSRYQIRILTKSKEVRWIEVFGNMIPYQGVPTGLATIIDITDQRAKHEQLEALSAELQEANRTKDKFFSIIAHDLRGPLSSVALLLQCMVKGMVEVKPDTLQICWRSTERVAGQFESLLTWAQSQQGRIKAHPVDFDLESELVIPVLELFNEMAQSKRVKLKADIAANCFAKGDVRLAETVLRNLVNNGIKYSFEGGVLMLRAWPQDNQIFVEVSDQGVGVDPANQAAIFAPSEAKISQPGTSNEQGSGMGLLLCKEFVQLNGGEIGVRSKKGAGATFWFTLPRGAVPQVKPVPCSLEGLKVLVMDDEPAQIHLAQLVLEAAGAEVFQAFNGPEALVWLKREAMDMVLMDLQLPGIDGFETAQKVAELERQPKLIALSALEVSEVGLGEADCPFDGYLAKPLRLAALRELWGQIGPKAI